MPVFKKQFDVWFGEESAVDTRMTWGVQRPTSNVEGQTMRGIVSIA